MINALHSTSFVLAERPLAGFWRFVRRNMCFTACVVDLTAVTVAFILSGEFGLASLCTSTKRVISTPCVPTSVPAGRRSYPLMVVPPAIQEAAQ